MNKAILRKVLSVLSRIMLGWLLSASVYASETTVIEKFDHQFGFSLPKYFEQGFEDQNENMYLAEYVIQGENVYNWSQMITVVMVKIDSPINMLDRANDFAYRMSTHCDDTFIAHRFLEPIKSNIWKWKHCL